MKVRFERLLDARVENRAVRARPPMNVNEKPRDRCSPSCKFRAAIPSRRRSARTCSHSEVPICPAKINPSWCPNRISECGERLASESNTGYAASASLPLNSTERNASQLRDCTIGPAPGKRLGGWVRGWLVQRQECAKIDDFLAVLAAFQTSRASAKARWSSCPRPGFAGSSRPCRPGA